MAITRAEQRRTSSRIDPRPSTGSPVTSLPSCSRRAMFQRNTLGISVVLVPRTPVRRLFSTTLTLEGASNGTLRSSALVHALDNVRPEASPATGQVTKDEPTWTPEACERPFDRTRRIGGDDEKGRFRLD